MNQSLPQVDLPFGMIHLGLGQPSNRLLPLLELETAAAQALGSKDPFFLAYGEEKGNRDFRINLAGFLSGPGDNPVDPDHLLITCGNSQALDFICTRFSRPGDTVFVEEPSYFLALKIFRDHHLIPVSIPMDADGLVVEALEEELEKTRPAFVYTIPAFHNPASVTLSPERRERLIQACARKDVLLVADEVYNFLSYDADPPGSMAEFKDQCRLVSLGSFSKILAPGLRLGWIHAGEEMINLLAGAGLLESGGGFNPFTSAVVNAVIEMGVLERHIQVLKQTYATRRDVLCRALKYYLPEDARFRHPAGGYFVWVEFSGGVNTSDWCSAAQSRNVDFHPGSLFSSSRTLQHCMRLSFSFYNEADLLTGVRRLGDLLSQVLQP